MNTYQILPVSSQNDVQDWKAYWVSKDQLWRTQPEINNERQAYLANRRGIQPNIEKGIYPFKNIDPKLNRADIEWLLATHENGRGPVDWRNDGDHFRDGLDLRGADLKGADLAGLPLAKTVGTIIGSVAVSDEQLENAVVHLEDAFLNSAHLEGSNLSGAYLTNANLNLAWCEKTIFFQTHLEKAELVATHLEGATLTQARMPGAIFLHAFFDSNTSLFDIILSDSIFGSASLTDLNWNGANLTTVQWSGLKLLGDEENAWKKAKNLHRKSDEKELLSLFRGAARANRQLSTVLRDQGIDDYSSYFSYRTRLMQHEVFKLEGNKRQRVFSYSMKLLSAYGYNPWFTVGWYLFFAILFTLLNKCISLLRGFALDWSDAALASITSLLGRGFTSSSFSGTVGHSLALISISEACIGLVLEAIFISALIQRFFSR